MLLLHPTHHGCQRPGVVAIENGASESRIPTLIFYVFGSILCSSRVCAAGAIDWREKETERKEKRTMGNAGEEASVAQNPGHFPSFPKGKLKLWSIAQVQFVTKLTTKGTAALVLI